MKIGIVGTKDNIGLGAALAKKMYEEKKCSNCFYLFKDKVVGTFCNNKNSHRCGDVVRPSDSCLNFIKKGN